MKNFMQILVVLVVCISVLTPGLLNAETHSTHSTSLLDRIYYKIISSEAFLREIADNDELHYTLERYLGDFTQDVQINRDGGSTTILLNNQNSSRNTIPFLGVTTSNLTLQRARQLGYLFDYGVLITSVVPNSAARESGLANGDILMTIGDSQILNTDDITNVLSRYFVGDTVKIEYFRDHVVQEVEAVLGSRNQGSSSRTITTTTTTHESNKKSKKSVGYGGGSWFPIWFPFDVSDVNHVLKEYGFNQLNDDGLLFHGFGGKGHVGKGYFIGGMYSFYNLERRANTNIQIPDKDDTVPVIRRYRYTTDYWGISLDKRYALHSKFLVSPGFMVGGASQRLMLSQTSAESDWHKFQHHLTSGYSVHDKLNKSYMLVQPRFELMYRLLPWLALRGEVGYMYGYSPYKGWKNTVLEDVYDIPNSPNSPYEGWSYSIGPWFGF